MLPKINRFEMENTKARSDSRINPFSLVGDALIRSKSASDTNSTLLNILQSICAFVPACCRQVLVANFFTRTHFLLETFWFYDSKNP